MKLVGWWLCLILVLGCGGSDGGAPPAEEPSSPEAAEPAVFNVKCPIMVDEDVDPELVVEFEGKKVGLCCDDCVEEWDAMTAGERRRALADLDD